MQFHDGDGIAWIYGNRYLSSGGLLGFLVFASVMVSAKGVSTTMRKRNRVTGKTVPGESVSGVSMYGVSVPGVSMSGETVARELVSREFMSGERMAGKFMTS